MADSVILNRVIPNKMTNPENLKAVLVFTVTGVNKQATEVNLTLL